MTEIETVFEYNLKVNELINRRVIELKKEVKHFEEEILEMKKDYHNNEINIKLTLDIMSKYKFMINYLINLKDDINRL